MLGAKPKNSFSFFTVLPYIYSMAIFIFSLHVKGHHWFITFLYGKLSIMWHTHTPTLYCNRRSGLFFYHSVDDAHFILLPWILYIYHAVKFETALVFKYNYFFLANWCLNKAYTFLNKHMKFIMSVNFYSYVKDVNNWIIIFPFTLIFLNFSLSKISLGSFKFSMKIILY